MSDAFESGYGALEPDNATEKAIKKETTDSLTGMYLRTNKQISRLLHLAHYANAESIDKSIRSEILRAIVVFAHALLEDTVREVLRLRWKDWSDALLDELSFSDQRGPTKVGHSYLKKYLTSTVEELIGQSANRFLDRTSVSKTTELCSLLSNLGINIAEALETTAKACNARYLNLTALQKFMTRRHQIAHNGDHDQQGDLNDLRFGTVGKWLFCVLACAQTIVAEAAANVDSPEKIQSLIRQDLDEFASILKGDH